MHGQMTLSIGLRVSSGSVASRSSRRNRTHSGRPPGRAVNWSSPTCPSAQAAVRWASCWSWIDGIHRGTRTSRTEGRIGSGRRDAVDPPAPAHVAGGRSSAPVGPPRGQRQVKRGDGQADFLDGLHWGRRKRDFHAGRHVRRPGLCRPGNRPFEDQHPSGEVMSTPTPA